MNYNCQKCKTSDFFPEEVVMFGGYKARLCRQCSNEWHEFLLESGKFPIKESDAIIMHYVARTFNDGINREFEIKELLQREQTQEAELFRAAKSWLMSDSEKLLSWLDKK
jgi:hypothetical protein